MADALSIRRAGEADAAAVAPLFDSYRQFYRQPADAAGAFGFISERLARGESTIFLAEDGEMPVGFAQLYPSFTSAGMARTFVLNDLFVEPAWRGRGVGTLLLRRVAAFARTEGAVRLTLSTAQDNALAQAVYEKEGWKRDSAFFAYQLALGLPEDA